VNRVAALVAAACAAALGAAGCSPQRSHIFGAHRYDPVGDCLEDATAVDVIEGPPPGECEPVRCWISPADEIYVTTACEAPPGYEDHTHDPETSSCGRALAAHAEGEAGRCPE
jgi:hypothetical protein